VLIFDAGANERCCRTHERQVEFAFDPALRFGDHQERRVVVAGDRCGPDKRDAWRAGNRSVRAKLVTFQGLRTTREATHASAGGGSDCRNDVGAG
jgi:hypothetical protein